MRRTLFMTGFFGLALLLNLTAGVLAQMVGISSAALQGFVILPQASGGLVAFHFVAQGGANQDATAVASGADQLYGWNIANINAAPVYVKLYNVASGCTSARTVIKTIGIPGNTALSGNNRAEPVGVAFSTGVCIRVTTGLPDSDTGTVTASTVTVDLDLDHT